MSKTVEAVCRETELHPLAKEGDIPQGEPARGASAEAGNASEDAQTRGPNGFKEDPWVLALFVLGGHGF